MFKKFLIISSVLFFAFSVLFLSFFNVSKTSLARAVAPLKFTVIPSPKPTVSPIPEIKYYLPYPGILPDHPLYTLKMVRDRIWLWLTTDSSKKVEVLLLFSDKRLGAAKALIEGNKINLGVSTLEKGEKYLERATLQLEENKQKGKEVKQIAKQLETAAKKHEEVILKLAETLGSEAKPVLEKLFIYSQDVLKRLQSLL